MANRHLNTPLGILALVAVLLGQPLLSAQAASHPATRDFLPPVASINPKLDESTATEAENGENSVEAVEFTAVTSPVLHTTPKITKLSNSLDIKTQQTQSLLDIQKKIDETDLEQLWQATVEKNPVIRFSLEKIATPTDLQPKQSSRFLTKTLSTLISGATLASTMVPGGGMYRNMGTMAVGNAMQNILEGKTHPVTNSLTPTEQIQLAGLIDDLKMKLIHNYQDYRNTLQQLAQSHEVTIKNNNLYSKALVSKNDMAIMASGTAYYQSLMNETALRQKAKLYRLTLERLAGADAVSALQLAATLPASGTADQTASIPVGTLLPSTTDLLPPEPHHDTTHNASTATSSEAGLPQVMEIGPQLSSEPGNLIGPLPPSIGPAAPATRKQRAKTTPNRKPASDLIGPVLEPKEDIHR